MEVSIKMAITEKKTFVYGDFKSGVRLSSGGATRITPPVPPPPVPPPPYSPYAIEILREFSASAFIGKVYQLSSSLRWEILAPEDAERADWYRIALMRPQRVRFEMQGSGQWAVQNVRIESDPEGRYVAVGLSNE